MNWILPRLALGSFEDAQQLVEHPYDHTHRCGILNLSEQFVDTNGHPVVWFPMADEHEYPPTHWRQLLALLTTAMQDHQSVLVHCRLGKSRSPALVAAYLATCGVYTDPESARAYVEAIRTETAIHPETWRGIMAYWEAR